MAVITSPTPGSHYGNGLSCSVYTVDNGTNPTNINARWQWNLTGAESSSNAGSDLQLQAIADDGFTILSTPISVDRSSGVVTIIGATSELFGDGTVSAPSIASNTNSASGLYFTTNAVNAAANGVRAVQFATATTGVNYFVMTPAAAGAAIALSAAGASTDIGLVVTPKGAGVVALGGTTAANSGLQVPITASAVDFLSVAGSTTGNHIVTLTATGTDTNVSMSLATKGSGVVAVGGTTQANSSLQVATTTSSVDYLSVAGSTTGNHIVTLTATGTDTDVSMSLATKGAGVVAVGGTTEANSSLQVATVTSSVDYLSVSGSTTGNHLVLLAAAGSDSVVDMLVSPKSTGSVYVTGTSTSAYGLKVVQTASTAVGVILTPAATGASATLAPQANTLILGAGTALATNAITGHVAIPTCAGTPTGTPTGTAIGHSQIIFDTTGVKLWAYKSGVGWVGVVLS